MITEPARIYHCYPCRGTVIGIDLGTTRSCVAFLQEDKTHQVIEASRATPSVVAFNGDVKLVGAPAKEQVNHKHNLITSTSHDPKCYRECITNSIYGQPYKLFIVVTQWSTQ